MLYLYVHWRQTQHLWSLNAPEVDAFLSQLPSSADVDGVAHHILRLARVYNLAPEHVLAGRVMGLEAVRPMRMQECFLLVDVAYQGLMLDDFQLWYSACQSVSCQLPD